MVDTYGRIGLLRAHECTERLVKSQNSNSQSFACLEKRNNDLENEEPPQDAQGIQKYEGYCAPQKIRFENKYEEIP